MPDVVVHGRQPDVRGCAMCHMPNGQGPAGKRADCGAALHLLVQQLTDFKNDLRTSAEPRKTNTAQMIQAAKAMTDDEIKAAATYFSSLKWTPWITVVEADDRAADAAVRQRVLRSGMRDRADRQPHHRDPARQSTRFELRDPHSGFIAYVPPEASPRVPRWSRAAGTRRFRAGSATGRI